MNQKNSKLLIQVCNDPEVLTVMCENIDLFLDATHVLRSGGHHAEQLRDTIRALMIEINMEAQSDS